MGDKVDSLPADKQHDSMTLDARTQTCPKYRKQQGYNILRMPQGKHEG